MKNASEMNIGGCFKLHKAVEHRLSSDECSLFKDVNGVSAGRA